MLFPQVQAQDAVELRAELKASGEHLLSIAQQLRQLRTCPASAGWTEDPACVPRDFAEMSSDAAVARTWAHVPPLQLAPLPWAAAGPTPMPWHAHQVQQHMQQNEQQPLQPQQRSIQQEASPQQSTSTHPQPGQRPSASPSAVDSRKQQQAPEQGGQQQRQQQEPQQQQQEREQQQRHAPEKEQENAPEAPATSPSTSDSDSECDVPLAKRRRALLRQRSSKCVRGSSPPVPHATSLKGLHTPPVPSPVKEEDANRQAAASDGTPAVLPTQAAGQQAQDTGDEDACDNMPLAERLAAMRNKERQHVKRQDKPDARHRKQQQQQQQRQRSPDEEQLPGAMSPPRPSPQQQQQQQQSLTEEQRADAAPLPPQQQQRHGSPSARCTQHPRTKASILARKRLASPAATPGSSSDQSAQPAALHAVVGPDMGATFPGGVPQEPLTNGPSHGMHGGAHAPVAHDTPLHDTMQGPGGTGAEVDRQAVGWRVQQQQQQEQAAAAGQRQQAGLNATASVQQAPVQQQQQRGQEEGQSRDGGVTDMHVDSDPAADDPQKPEQQQQQQQQRKHQQHQKQTQQQQEEQQRRRQQQEQQQQEQKQQQQQQHRKHVQHQQQEEQQHGGQQQEQQHQQRKQQQHQKEGQQQQQEESETIVIDSSGEAESPSPPPPCKRRLPNEGALGGAESSKRRQRAVDAKQPADTIDLTPAEAIDLTGAEAAEQAPAARATATAAGPAAKTRAVPAAAAAAATAFKGNPPKPRPKPKPVEVDIGQLLKRVVDRLHVRPNKQLAQQKGAKQAPWVRASAGKASAAAAAGKATAATAASKAAAAAPGAGAGTPVRRQQGGAKGGSKLPGSSRMAAAGLRGFKPTVHAGRRGKLPATGEAAAAWERREQLEKQAREAQRQRSKEQQRWQQEQEQQPEQGQQQQQLSEEQRQIAERVQARLEEHKQEAAAREAAAARLEVMRARSRQDLNLLVGPAIRTRNLGRLLQLLGVDVACTGGAGRLGPSLGDLRAAMKAAKVKFHPDRVRAAGGGEAERVRAEEISKVLNAWDL